LRKACHWIQNSGMHVAVTHTGRYKEEPSGILPRQTSQLKSMHSRSSLSLPWFPMLRVNRNERSQKDDDQRTDSTRRNLTRSLKHTKPECLYPFLYVFLFTSTIGYPKKDFEKERSWTGATEPARTRKTLLRLYKLKRWSVLFGRCCSWLNCRR
jgi:hypothetical protein